MSTYDPVVWEAFPSIIHKRVVDLERDVARKNEEITRLEQRIAALECIVASRPKPFDSFDYHFPQPRPEPEPEYEILAWNTEMFGPLPDKTRKLKLSEIQELSVFKRKQ